mgnify:CR=1 FL=1
MLPWTFIKQFLRLYGLSFITKNEHFPLSTEAILQDPSRNPKIFQTILARHDMRATMLSWILLQFAQAPQLEWLLDKDLTVLLCTRNVSYSYRDQRARHKYSWRILGTVWTNRDHSSYLFNTMNTKWHTIEQNWITTSDNKNFWRKHWVEPVWPEKTYQKPLKGKKGEIYENGTGEQGLLNSHTNHSFEKILYSLAFKFFTYLKSI